MAWFIENRRDLFEIVVAVHAVAALIVNLTPTPADDRAVGTAGAMIRQAYRAIEILGGIVTPLAKR